MEDRVITARSFFAEQQIEHLVATRSIATRALAPPATKAAGSQFTYLVVESEMPADAMNELKAQRQYLIDLAGVATAYVQRQCTKQNNPDLMWNADLWQQVFTKLPMCSVPKFVRRQEKKSVKGIEIATKFVAELTGMIVAGPELAPFVSFLQQMQENIKITSTSSKNDFSFGTIAITLASQSVAGQSFIEGYLKGTFVKFSNSQQIIESNCAKAASFDFDMDIKDGQMLLNYGALRAGGAVKTNFDAFLTGTQVAAIEEADSFFNFTNAEPA